MKICHLVDAVWFGGFKRSGRWTEELIRLSLGPIAFLSLKINSCHTIDYFVRIEKY